MPIIAALRRHRQRRSKAKACLGYNGHTTTHSPHPLHACVCICMCLLECTHVLWRRLTSGIFLHHSLPSARLPGLSLLSFPEVLGLQVCATMPSFSVGSRGFEHMSSRLHSEHFIKLAPELVNSECNTWSICNLVQCVTSPPGKSFENTDTASFCVPNHHVIYVLHTVSTSETQRLEWENKYTILLRYGLDLF